MFASRLPKRSKKWRTSCASAYVSSRGDDICVTSNGKYVGTVTISSLLDAITQRALHLAQGANPLSGLPSNEALRREIEKRIAQMMHFDTCYIDIDNFKPFNDAYGFDCGDAVLRRLSNYIQDTVAQRGENGDFIGHIGGDDLFSSRAHRPRFRCVMR